MRLHVIARLAVVCVSLWATGCATTTAPATDGWQKVGGRLANVSGMALVTGERSSAVGPVEFLVAHDNKAPGEPHVSSVVVGFATGLSYRPLAWPQAAAPPADLEAICPLPQTPGSFLALTSAGRLLHLRYAGRRAGSQALEVLHESMLPELDPHPDLEGFAVQSLGETSVAIWADRGDGKKPATLYFGTYDPVADVVALQGRAEVAVPYPSGHNTRHVTDLRLDDGGVVWGTATRGAGDEGPFSSAVYALGAVHVNGGAVAFVPARSLTPLWTSRHKIEAIELVPGPDGGVYFGADDEAAGGWIYTGGRAGSRAGRRN